MQLCPEVDGLKINRRKADAAQDQPKSVATKASEQRMSR
jgi:hypothetical protein